MTLTLPASLALDLEAYAQAWSQETGRTLPARALVPHILEAFIRSDRGFAQVRKTLGAPAPPVFPPPAGAAD